MSAAKKIDLELGDFKPFAYYDKFLDCIRVYTHDRSITEQRLDDVITVFHCNHRGPFDPAYVGFSLKGVRHMLDEIGLPMDRAYSLAVLLNELVTKLPSQINKALLEMTLHSHPYNGDLEVNFAEAA